MYHHSQLQSDKKTADKANCRLSDCFTLKYKFMECKRIFVLSNLKRLKIVRIHDMISDIRKCLQRRKVEMKKSM